ncbi:MAG TPA: outer membrane beta-barrel protein [Kofleriaceae bacterium]|nr:outer membrane beta-barrel protein [Kofleriaceae bacterium]
MLERTVPVLFVAVTATVASAQPTPTPAAPTPAPAAELEAEPEPAVEEPAPAEPAPIAPAVTAEPAEPAATVTATAGEAPARWYDAIEVNGFASVAFTYNTNRPAEKENQLRAFDTDDGNVNVDVIELVIQKAASDPGQAGFRVDLTAGSSIPAAAASAGLFRDADGNAQDFDLQQGFVSYIAKAGKGLRIDAGKFVTHMGYELIEGYDGYNDNYSRSILFGFAIPFTHTGVKLSYPLTDKITGMLMVANGWDNVKDNNDGKTFGAQLVGTFGKVTGYLNYVGGPEQDGNNGNFRHVLDLVVTAAVNDKVSLGFNADYGFEKDAVMGGDATWAGAALYAKLAATDALSVAARAEIFDDADGVRTGAPQRLIEATISPALKLGDNFVLRGDVRFDTSDEESYMTDDGTSKQQLTLAVNAIGIL